MMMSPGRISQRIITAKRIRFLRWHKSGSRDVNAQNSGMQMALSGTQGAFLTFKM